MFTGYLIVFLMQVYLQIKTDGQKKFALDGISEILVFTLAEI